MLIPEAENKEIGFRLVQATAGSDEAKTRIREIVRADPDWSQLLKYIAAHGLLPHLYHSLQGVEDEVPEEVYETLHTRYEQITLHNLQFVQKLHDITETFNGHDIQAIPYKGPILAQAAYGDIGRRQFGDLDFLVAEADVLRARTVLQGRGYEQTNLLSIPPSVLVKNKIFRWEREFRFSNDEDGVQIELRSRFIGSNQSNGTIFDDLWQRRTTVSVAGQTVQGLSSEDRALVLLTHGTKHGWCRLSWVCDIARVLQHNIDWELVLNRAEDYDLKTAALLGLGVTAELADVKLPEYVQREFTDNYRAVWGTAALITLFERDLMDRQTDLERLTVIIFLNDGFVDSVRELFNAAFAPRYADVEFVQLPMSLYPLYYFVRILKIGPELVRKAWKLLE